MCGKCLEFVLYMKRFESIKIFGLAYWRGKRFKVKNMHWGPKCKRKWGPMCNGKWRYQY